MRRGRNALLAAVSLLRLRVPLLVHIEKKAVDWGGACLNKSKEVLRKRVGVPKGMELQLERSREGSGGVGGWGGDLLTPPFQEVRRPLEVGCVQGGE